MRKVFSITILVGLLLNSGCIEKKVDLGTFDVQKFKTDRGGCNGKRVEMINDLKGVQSRLLGLSQNQIFETLGRYDFQILDRRNQKYFVYYLEKGPHCEQIQNPTKAQSMALKFNAVSLVKEVTFQVGMP